MSSDISASALRADDTGTTLIHVPTSSAPPPDPWAAGLRVTRLAELTFPGRLRALVLMALLNHAIPETWIGLRLRFLKSLGRCFQISRGVDTNERRRPTRSPITRCLEPCKRRNNFNGSCPKPM